MWTLLREVSLRHLRHAPLRSALVVFGIALGVTMLAAMLATNQTLNAAFEDMVARVAGKADLTIVGSEAGIPSALTAELAELEGVAHAAAMLEIVSHVARPNGGTLLVLGVDLLGDTFFLPFSELGARALVEDPLAFVNDPRAILISRKLAARYGLGLGSELPLITAEGVRHFRVRGLLDDRGPAASYGGQVAVMFMDAAQVSFARGQAVDRIDVALARGSDLAATRRRIERRLAGRAAVEAPKGRTRRLVASLAVFRNALNLSALIALGVSGFLIYNAVSVSVAQRRREIGIMRALGVTRARMMALFCLEALVLAAVGVALGLVFAKQLAGFALHSVSAIVSRVFVSIQPAPPRISAEVAALGAAAGFATTLLAALLPARASNRIDPAEAMRSTRLSALTPVRNWQKLALSGVALALSTPLFALCGTELSGYLATAAILAGFALAAPLTIAGLCALFARGAERGFGVPGRLALDNVRRALGRNALTVIALMLAIAMSMTSGAYARAFERSIFQWVDDSLSADAWVTAGSPTPDRNHVALAPAVIDKLQGVPGLAAVNPMRTFSIGLGDRRVVVQAAETRMQLAQNRSKSGRSRKLLAGPAELPVNALYEAPRVLVSENLARFLGLSVGDQLKLETARGRKPFQVYAVVVDYTSEQGWLLLDRRWYSEYWPAAPIDVLELYFEPGADRERVLEALRARLSASAGMFVSSHAALRDEVTALARNLFAYARAPELITLLVAIMGVLGTMLASVIDRIRELGLLRAVGASRRQIAASLVIEAGFLGFVAALCGVLLGVPQGYLFMRVIGMAANGWYLPYGFPLETALRVCSVVIAAALAGGSLPGLSAARMDVPEALSYE